MLAGCAFLNLRGFQHGTLSGMRDSSLQAACWHVLGAQKRVERVAAESEKGRRATDEEEEGNKGGKRYCTFALFCHH